MRPNEDDTRSLFSYASMARTKTIQEPHALAERLRVVRQGTGWTQKQLAHKAGTTQAAIQKIESGRSLHPRRLDAIARALGVAPEWLLYGSESIEILDKETIEVALAFSRLDEPYRSALREAIIKIASQKDP